jgi:hypothetical protein
MFALVRLKYTGCCQDIGSEISGSYSREYEDHPDGEGNMHF